MDVRMFTSGVGNGRMLSILIQFLGVRKMRTEALCMVMSHNILWESTKTNITNIVFLFFNKTLFIEG